MASRKPRRPRDDILAELRVVGRLHSDATVLYHAAVAARMGVRPADWKAMSVLERAGPMSAGELARHTGLTAASVTDLLDRLEARGFVLRDRDPSDRRRVAIRLAPDAVAQARRWLAPAGRSLGGLLADYSDAELEVIADFLARNAERMREETAKVEAADDQPPDG